MLGEGDPRADADAYVLEAGVGVEGAQAGAARLQRVDAEEGLVVVAAGPGRTHAQDEPGVAPWYLQAATELDPQDPATWGKVPRNAPCPCQSGRKYKHCHGRLG